MDDRGVMREKVGGERIIKRERESKRRKNDKEKK